jgi:hypothetical protein
VENQRLEGQHSAEAARLQCRIAVHAALRSIYLKQRRLGIFRSALSTRDRQPPEKMFHVEHSNSKASGPKPKFLIGKENLQNAPN